MAARSGGEHPVTELLADRVRHLRDQRGWSAQRLAEECDLWGEASLSRGTISKIECRDRKWVTPDEIDVLAHAFSVAPAVLLGENASLTILHLSGLRIVADSRADPAEQDCKVLLRWLLADLDRMLDKDSGFWPDLVVISGGLTASGGVREFDAARVFLDDLADYLRLEQYRIVIVPGDSDVNLKKCQAYFTNCDADEVDSLPPYFPKLEHFQKLFASQYSNINRVEFGADQPWALFKIVDLQIVVAGLNSTMAMSHLPQDTYGQVGQEQAAWFAERLADYQDQGWLRLGVVNHSPLAGAPEQERLRDADTVDEQLGERLNLLLHGHGSGVTTLRSGLLALGTGAAATEGTTRAPRQAGPVDRSHRRYQLLQVTANRLGLWDRTDDPDRVAGHAPPTLISRTWRAAGTTFPTPAESAESADVRPSDRDMAGIDSPANERVDDDPRKRTVLQRVKAVYRARHPDADWEIVQSDPPCALVTYVDDENIVRQVQVGVCLGEPDHDDLENFLAAHPPDPGSDSELVYQGSPPDSSVMDEARRRGISLRSLTELMGQLDLRGYVRRQAEQLAADRAYPTEKYRSQPFQEIGVTAQRATGPRPRAAGAGETPGDAGSPHVQGNDLLAEVLDRLYTPTPRLVTVLADPATGTRFLRELARRLPKRLPALPPILVEPQVLQNYSGLTGRIDTVEELVCEYLRAHGEGSWFTSDKFRVLVRDVLIHGKAVLLLDGFDHWVAGDTGADTRDSLADQITMLCDAASRGTRIVTTRAIPTRNSDLEQLRRLMRGHPLLHIEDPQPPPATVKQKREKNKFVSGRGPHFREDPGK